MSPRTALDEMSKDGAFRRKDSAWRNWISREADATFPPEAGRYHLYVAYAWYVAMLCGDATWILRHHLTVHHVSLPAHGHIEL